MEAKDIMIKKSLGTWTPNYRLSNVAMTYFESAQYAHRRIFPVCPVNLPSGYFYEFSKEDLARDNLQIKPPFGSVQPAIFGMNEQNYSCKVYQILIGMDEILVQPYEREALDPRKLRVQTIIEQISLHQEIDFAQKFFNANAWANTWQGSTSYNAAQKKFKKFDASTPDNPIILFDELSTTIRRNGRRRPTKLVLGMDTFTALKNNPHILERVKYSGATANPALVNENVLAQLFGLESVVVLDATYNDAKIGQPENMKFVCDSKGALLLYAPDTPRIDTPSAGYTFVWNIAGGNDLVAITEYDQQDASHVRLLEGLIAFDQRITAQTLGIFLSDCCS